MRAALLLSAILAVSPSAAFAQVPDQPQVTASENGRYTMTPTANGFLRLDTRTGAVSLCTVNNGAAECRAAADDRAALMDEIDRLHRRNAEADIKPQAPAAPQDRRFMPNKEDMDRALDFAEQFMRRMMRIMRDDPPRDPT